MYIAHTLSNPFASKGVVWAGFCRGTMIRGPALLRPSPAWDVLKSFICVSPRSLNTTTSTTDRLLREPPSRGCGRYIFLTNHRQSPRFFSRSRPSSHGQAHPPPPHSQKHHKDLYSILKISPTATQQQIKEQFYQLSMLYHPDRNTGSQTAHQRFSEITEAYSILGQHTLRRKYDKGLLQEYPRKPRHGTHTHSDHYQSGTTASMSSTPKKVYDFDEFYRAHYGEALKWQRERTASKKAAAAEAARLEALSEPMHRLLIISVVLSVFFVGIVGSKYRLQQEKEGK